MSPQYGKLRPTSGGWDRFGSLRHPIKFQRVSLLGFVTAATSLTGGQPKFARCLAVSCAGTPYIHFWGLMEFCQVQNSLRVQVLRSPILAALLHGTPAAGMSQTLRRATGNWITGLSQRAPPIFGWVAITLGIGTPHSSFNTEPRLNDSSYKTAADLWSKWAGSKTRHITSPLRSGTSWVGSDT